MSKSEVVHWARLLRDGCLQGSMEELHPLMMNIPDQKGVWGQFIANTSAYVVLPLKIYTTHSVGDVMARHIAVVSALWPKEDNPQALVASEEGLDALKSYFDRMGSTGAGHVWWNTQLRAMFPLEHPVRPLWIRSLQPVTWLNMANEIGRFLPSEGLERVSWMPWSKHSNANHSLVLRFLPEMAELMVSLGNQNWDTAYVLDMACAVYGEVEPRWHGLPALDGMV